MDFLYHLHQERDDLVYDCFQIFIIFDGLYFMNQSKCNIRTIKTAIINS